MAELFQTTVPNVSMHIRNVFAEGELQADSVIKEFLTTAADGKNYSTKYYNLDASISQIRTVIFALSTSTREGSPAVRHAVIDLANEFASPLSKTPTVSFSGPVDLMISNDLADDVLATEIESEAARGGREEAEEEHDLRAPTAALRNRLHDRHAVAAECDLLSRP